jgi:membrane protein DedA with SNARE-associated domain
MIILLASIGAAVGGTIGYLAGRRTETEPEPQCATT